MTEKEATYKSRELQCQVQASKLRDAEMRLAEGFKKLKAEFDEKLAMLKSDVEREKLELERQNVWAAEAKANLERGFDQ